jgi:hypothetical protein
MYSNLLITHSVTKYKENFGLLDELASHKTKRIEGIKKCYPWHLCLWKKSDKLVLVFIHNCGEREHK